MLQCITKTRLTIVIVIITFFITTTHHTAIGQSVSDTDIQKIVRSLESEHNRLDSAQAFGDVEQIEIGGIQDEEKQNLKLHKIPMPPNSGKGTFHEIFFTAFKGNKRRYVYRSVKSISNESPHDLNELLKPTLDEFTTSKENFYDGVDTYDNMYIIGGTRCTPSHRHTWHAGIRDFAFTVPLLGEWSDVLLKTGRFHISKKSLDRKYGEIYECQGTMSGNFGSNSPPQTSFWIAPKYNYRVIRSSYKYLATSCDDQIDEMKQISGMWVPVTASRSVSFLKDGIMTESEKYIFHFNSISLNNVSDDMVSFRYKTGWHVQDHERGDMYVVGEHGEKIYRDRSGKDTRPDYKWGWLFMASVSMLLILTVGAYVKWKRKQLSKSA